MKITEKKLANNMSSIVKIDHQILGCPINTCTHTLFRAKKFIAFICCKFFGPEQCICAGIYGTT